jgi:hypothetical protein
MRPPEEVDVSRPLPNFFIPGAAKAGTTSLHRYLAQHPEIFMTEEKEPHFFTRRWDEAEDEAALAEAEQTYRERFAPGREQPVRGESTPAYLHRPEVPERIASLAPDARFLVSLRDPIERAHSDYAMRVRIGAEDRSFREVVDAELAAGPDAEQFLIDRGRYDEHLDRYLDAFGREQLCVVMFETLKTDTRTVLEEAIDVLGVDPAGIEHIDHETVHNPGGQPRNPLAEWLLTDERLHAIARRIVPEPVRIWLGDHVLVEEGNKPPREPEAVERLVDVFEPSVAHVEQVLDRELPELRASWP